MRAPRADGSGARFRLPLGGGGIPGPFNHHPTVTPPRWNTARVKGSIPIEAGGGSASGPGWDQSMLQNVSTVPRGVASRL